MLPTKLTATDAYGHLNDNERTEFKSCIDQIAEGLKTCMDIGDKVPLYDVHFGDVFFQRGIISEFRRKSWFPLFSLKLLLEKACSRKLEKERREVEEAREKKRREEEQERQEAAKAEEERKRQIEKAEQERKEKEEQERQQAEKAEYKKRRDDAYKVVNPPIDDAKVYLDDKEFEKFTKATNEAIDVYLKESGDYLHDDGTFDYRGWLWKINYRKEEARQKIAAKIAAQEYNRELNKEIANLRSKLDPQKKTLSTYLQLKIKDKRYTDHNFDYILSKEEVKNFDRTLVRIANKRVEQLIPDNLRQFIDIPSQYYRIYFPLPSVSYSFAGVPCLDFAFDIFATAYGEVWLKPGKKNFGDYEFHLPRIEERNYSVLLQEPKLLGYYYLVLKPEELGGYVPWESIPLELIKGLMNGELQPAGTTILAASENGRTYRIKNFKEEVTIPRSFENYLKKIGNIEQMVSIGIVDQEVAIVIKENLGPSATERRTGAFQNGQVAGFTDEELISSLTSLGLARKASEELCGRVPRNLSLDEAIKFALQNQS